MFEHMKLSTKDDLFIYVLNIFLAHLYKYKILFLILRCGNETHNCKTFERDICEKHYFYSK